MPDERQGPLARGRPCRKCGADEWVLNERGYHRCNRCLKGWKNDWKAKQDPSWKLWNSAKARARAAGVDFTITAEDVRRVWPANGRCPALGILLVKGEGKVQDASPTLDRKNAHWGYTPDNIVVISFRANRAKGGLTAQELESIADWMRREGLG